MNVIEKLQKNLQITHDAIKKVLDIYSDEDSMYQFYGEMNHARWQTGHMIMSAYLILNIVGVDEKASPEYKKLFEGGSKISSDVSLYPEFGKLKSELYALWDKIYVGLDKNTADDLDREVTLGEDWKTNRIEALLFLIAHDFYHLGQVVQAMRSLGKPRPFI